MAIDRAFVTSPPENLFGVATDDISAVTNEPFIPDNHYILGTSTTYAELNNVTDETRYTNKTKEIKMTNVLSIETGATLINGKPSSNFTEDQIINMITCENEKIKTFESVTTQSVNINNKVEACKDNIGLLIAILDEDEEIIE